MLNKQNLISRLIYYSWITLSFLVILIAVYAPLIQTGYYFYEDYYYFALPRGMPVDFLFHEAVENGRLLEFLLMYLQSIYMDSSESTKAIRLVGIIGLTLFASVIYAVLKRCRFRSDQAFLISLLICILPSTQQIAAYMLIAPHILSALLSSLSALVMFNVAFKEEGKKRIDSIIRGITAIVLLIAALNINQPPAMMYWALGAIFFLSGDMCNFSKKECRQPVIRYFFIGFISSAIYYVVFLKVLPSIMNIPHHRGKLISIQHIPHQLIDFLTGALRLSMNLWNLNPSHIVLIFTGAIIFTGIILNSLKEMNEKKEFSVSNLLIKYLMVLFMIMLSYLPKLMVTDPGYPVYQLLALASSIAVLFCFGLINFVEFFKFIPNFSAKMRKSATTLLLTMLTIIAALSAHNNLKTFASVHAAELNHLKNSIQEYGVSKLLNNPKIYIRRPRWTPPIPWENLNMQFNKGLTTHSEGGFILYVVGQALYEVAVKQRLQITYTIHPSDGIKYSVVGPALHEDGAKQVKEIQIYHGAADDPIPEDKNLLVIDMTKVEATPRLYGFHDIGAWATQKIIGLF